MVRIFPRKTLIYGGVLVALILVFIVQETTQTRRNAIPVPEIVDEVDQIRIEGADEALAFSRTDTGWTLGDEAYPVNPDSIAAILDTVDVLDAVDVVTDRGDAADYGLEATSRRTLRLFTGDIEPVALQLGDSAAAGNAVYGRVNTSDEIVLLPVSLDTAVALDPFRYREKTMAAIPEDSIVAVRIESPRFETVTVQRKIDDAGAGDNASSGDTSGVETEWEASGIGEIGNRGTDSVTDSPREGSSETPNPTDGVAPTEEPLVAPAQLNALIRELVAVEATGFPEYDETEDNTAFEGDPFATVAVERNGGDIVTIDLWPPDGERRIPALSSTTDQRFYIPEWRARRLLLGLNRYLDPYTVEESS